MSPSAMLYVFGAGGHGKVVADVARSAGFILAGFIDDSTRLAGEVVWGVPILTWAQVLAIPRTHCVVGLGIGVNATREKCAKRVDEAGFALPTLVHSAAVVARTATLGPGTVLMAGTVVNPDAVLGKGCIVNTGGVVEHDCALEDWVHLSPNAALGGGVRIGKRTHLGLGAVALPGVSIGRDVTVGAGSVVLRDVADGLIVVGVPASPIGQRGCR